MAWWAAPLAITAGTALNAYLQKQMMTGYQKGQERSYDKWLQALNPPEEVKAERFAGLESQILEGAPAMRKRQGNIMASRGIRGEGAASPIAGGERDIQKAINQAYFNVYGSYNVPGSAPPVGYTPSTGQMFGAQGTDLLNIWAMSEMFGGK